jgi:hypothetical protein
MVKPVVKREQQEMNKHELMVEDRDVSMGLDRLLSRSTSHTENRRRILRDIVIGRLTNDQALFYFSALATKANLNPRFTFKHGFQDTRRVGVLLTLYGHTIVVEARYTTPRGAKAAACRQALAELRHYNPQWAVPTEPMEGPTDVTWNWTWLLKDYCAQNGLSGPRYTPRHEATFHCDVLINGEKLSTWRQCGSFHEAQQTVAHVAFHQLMVNEDDDKVEILPADSAEHVEEYMPLARFPGVRKTLGISGSGIPDKVKYDSFAALSGVRSGGVQKSHLEWARTRSCSSRNQNLPRDNSNYVPLKKRRLIPPPRMQESPIDNNLKILKEIQEDLRGWQGKDIVFYDVMTGKDQNSPSNYHFTSDILYTAICSVLKANPPQFLWTVNVDGPAAYPYMLHAKFDSTHGCLARPGHITFGPLTEYDKPRINEIGAMFVVRLLLNLLRENAGVANGQTHTRQLASLATFEIRMHHAIAIHSQAVPSSGDDELGEELGPRRMERLLRDEAEQWEKIPEGMEENP